MAVAVQADQQIGVGRVGEAGALGLVGVLVVAVGQEGVDADGLQPAFELGRRGRRRCRARCRPPTLQPVSLAAVSGIQDDRLAGQRRAGAAQLLGLAQLVRAARRRRCAAAVSSSRRVIGPQQPSLTRPRLCWNSRSASSVRLPKIPSQRPTSKPMSASRFCSSCTSSPAKGWLTLR